MAEKTAVPRLNMRYGIIYHAPTRETTLSDIRLPELDPKFYILTKDAVPGENEMNFLGTPIPLLFSDEKAYAGNPLCAIFAPDYESAIIAERMITPEEKKEEPSEGLEMPFDEYGWGRIQDFKNDSEIKEEAPETKEGGSESQETAIKKDDYRKMETEFRLDPIVSSPYELFTAEAWLEGGLMHIKVPTQYPAFVKKTVAASTALDEKKIMVHALEGGPTNDEYLLEPARLSALAAIACIETKGPIQLRDRAHNRRGLIQTKRTTWFSQEAKPIAEEVEHTVDIGAYPVLFREYQRQAITGLIPSYPLQAFRVKVRIKCTPQYPSFLFSSLGYSEALAATEYHENEIARMYDISPLQFRLMAYKEKRKFTDYLPAVEMAEIKKLLLSVGEKSSFDRKWSSYSLQKGDPSLIGYSRGIAISSGIGIAGFSTSFISENEFQAKLTYTQKNTVLISTSAVPSGALAKFWKKLVKDTMGLAKDEDVFFSAVNQDTPDSGPKILARLICNFSKQLVLAAKKLKQLKETEKPPFSLLVDIENRYFPCEFDEGSFAAMAVEVSISEYDYHPIVEEIWAEYSIGLIIDESSMVNSIKQNILKLLSFNGISVSKDFQMHISLRKRDTESIAAIESVTKAMLLSGITSAFRQAMGNKSMHLPTSSAEILAARRTKDEG